MTENVLNFFEQPGTDGDNKLICGGTVQLDGTTNVGGDLETGSGQSLRKQYTHVMLSFTGSGGRGFVVPGFAGTISTIYGVIGSAATANTTIGFKIGAGGTSITGGDLSITNLDAIGTDYTSNPTANNVITDTDVVEALVTGGGYAGGAIEITMVVELS